MFNDVSVNSVNITDGEGQVKQTTEEKIIVLLTEKRCHKEKTIEQILNRKCVSSTVEIFTTGLEIQEKTIKKRSTTTRNVLKKDLKNER